MKNILIIFIFTKIAISIGLEALNIPSSATSAGIAGTGIAFTEDVWINPASIHIIEKKSIRFTGYNWLGNIPGHEISLFWKGNRPHYISIQSLSIDDIELYGDIPQDKPLGTFSSNWIAGNYATGFEIENFKTAQLD